MLSEDRYAKIIARIGECGSATVNELAEMCGVSIETVRRDLVLLEAHGRLRRVFGGAVPVQTAARFEDFPVRQQANRAKKIAVASVIASLVYEGDVIALDAGTTAVETAEVLKNRFKRLTVVTYSFKVFEALKDTFDVLLTGGEYYAKEPAFFGELAVSAVRQLHIDKCFLFPSAVSLKYGIEDYVPSFVPVQREMIARSDHVFVAADSSKFGGRALIRVCDLSPDYVYVTDAELPAETAETFTKNGYTLIKGD